MKYFLSIIEIENKTFRIWYNTNTPVKLVFDQLIMSLDVLNSHNLPGKIDHPNYTSLTTKIINLDEIFQNYFKESSIEDVICEKNPWLIQKQK